MNKYLMKMGMIKKKKMGKIRMKIKRKIVMKTMGIEITIINKKMSKKRYKKCKYRNRRKKK